MDPITIATIIVEALIIANKIRAQANQANANKDQCEEIAKTIDILKPVLESLKTDKNNSLYKPAMDDLYKAMEDIYDLIWHISDKTRFMAFLKAHNNMLTINRKVNLFYTKTVTFMTAISVDTNKKIERNHQEMLNLNKLIIHNQLKAEERNERERRELLAVANNIGVEQGVIKLYIKEMAQMLRSALNQIQKVRFHQSFINSIQNNSHVHAQNGSSSSHTARDEAILDELVQNNNNIERVGEDVAHIRIESERTSESVAHLHREALRMEEINKNKAITAIQHLKRTYVAQSQSGVIMGADRPLDIQVSFSREEGAQQIASSHLSEHFDAIAQAGACILLNGEEGSGKSTVLDTISRAWGADVGGFSKFDWVFKLDLDEWKNGLLLHEWIFKTYFRGNTRILMSTFEMLWANYILEAMNVGKVLILLDGIDKLINPDSARALLDSIVDNKAVKMIASKHHDLTKNGISFEMKKMHILGYSDDDMMQFIRGFFGRDDNEAAEKINGAIKVGHPLWKILHNLNKLNMICNILKKNAHFISLLDYFTALRPLYEEMEIRCLSANYLKTLDQNTRDEFTRKSEVNQVKTIKNEYFVSRLAFSRLVVDSFLAQRYSPSINTGMCFKVRRDDLFIQSLLDSGMLKIHRNNNNNNHYDELLIDCEFSDPSFYYHFIRQYIYLQAESGTFSTTLIQDLARITRDRSFHPTLLESSRQIGLAIERPDSPTYLSKLIWERKQVNRMTIFLRSLVGFQSLDTISDADLDLLIRCTEENWQLASKSPLVNEITKQVQARIFALYQRFTFEKGEWFYPPIWANTINRSKQGHYKNQSGLADVFYPLSSGVGALATLPAGTKRFSRWLNINSPLVLKSKRTKIDSVRANLGSFQEVDQLLHLILMEYPDLFAHITYARSLLCMKEDAESVGLIIDALYKVFDKGNPTVKNHITWAIFLIRHRAYSEYEGMLHLLKYGTNVDKLHVLYELLYPASKTPSETLLEQIAILLKSRNTDIKTAVLKLMIQTGSAAITEPILKSLFYLYEKSDNLMKADALTTLASMGPSVVRPSVVELLSRSIDSDSNDVKTHALIAIRQLNINEGNGSTLLQKFRMHLKHGVFSGCIQEAVITLGHLALPEHADEFGRYVVLFLKRDLYLNYEDELIRAFRKVAQSVSSKSFIIQLYSDIQHFSGTKLAFSLALLHMAVAQYFQVHMLTIEEDNYKPLISALILGSLLAGGRIDFSLDWDEREKHYVWNGISSEQRVVIHLTFDQAQWVKSITPKLQEAFNKGVLNSLLKEINAHGYQPRSSQPVLPEQMGVTSTTPAYQRLWAYRGGNTVNARAGNTIKPQVI